jgi:hypothetical protein
MVFQHFQAESDRFSADLLVVLTEESIVVHRLSKRRIPFLKLLR